MCVLFLVSIANEDDGMSKVMEQLDKALEEKDRRIAELEEKIERLEYHDEWSWRQIKKLTEEENLGLPLPRLELRYRVVSNYCHFVDYGIVYRHLLDDIEFVPIGSTKINGKVRQQLDTPYRDGAHMFNDMFEMNLPGFVVNGSDYRELTFDDVEVPSSVKVKVKKKAQYHG